mmetsp:Transcript_36800/g.58967  ORF Transcript_36800/g.58967 Transcript_36800/m.58967 type:complete len:252 (-) Transcript_36800:150-905(-)
MMQQQDYSNNFISSRSTTKRIHAPGGGSTIGSLLFGGGDDDSATPSRQSASPRVKKENTDTLNSPTNQEESLKQPQPASNVDCEQKQAVQSDAEKVREFTFEAGQPTPDKPQVMDVDEVNFITKMVLDELLELYATVLPPQMAKKAMKKMIDEAKPISKLNVGPNGTHELIAEQADAFVDIWYYSLNCMAKKGVNLSKIFDVVHNANMAKRDPATGKFLKRADGKIIKPAGWMPPDIKSEISRQLNNGAWK